MSETGRTIPAGYSASGHEPQPVAVPLSSKLTVIFYIALCLEAGVILILLPWMRPFGLGDWGDNFFLIQLAQATGSQGLQQAVASGWVRGAVSGVGALNLLIAFWEIFNFKRTVRSLSPTTTVQPPQLAGDQFNSTAASANNVTRERTVEDEHAL